MKNNNTKAEAIISLQERGYDKDFILNSEYILCVQHSELISPEKFVITETYRFDGEPRLRDNFIIYAITVLNKDIKVILLTSYSALTMGMSIHLWSKLAINIT